MRGGGRQVTGNILIIDLTEERSPLLTDGAGHFITFSEVATWHTNLEKLFFKQIIPFSLEHVELIREFLPTFALEISKLHGIEHIVIHRAFFAGANSHIIHVNNCLMEFYDLFAQYLPNSISIEVPKELRVSSIMHKWGPYGLHMVDEYYKFLIFLISRELGLPIQIKNEFSVQNIEKSTFFHDSQSYCDYLKSMHRGICSPSWLYQMQYQYIVERELEKRDLEIQRRSDYVLKADITPWWLMKKAAKRVVQKTKNFVIALYMKLGRQ